MYYTECKPKDENRGGLGTRLVITHFSVVVLSGLMDVVVLIGLVNHCQCRHLTAYCHHKRSLVVELVHPGRQQLNLAGQVGSGLLSHQPTPNEGQEETKLFQITYIVSLTPFFFVV